jgi:hypothetical protein
MCDLGNIDAKTRRGATAIRAASEEISSESMLRICSIATVPACLVAASGAQPASAQKKYDVGATDTEIKLGNIVPYSGPASAFGSVGKVQAAYFKMIKWARRHQRAKDQLHLL